MEIKADLVLEILGRPAEHIKNALISLVEKLGTEKGVKINDKKIHEPTQIKEANDLYTTFAEVSVELDSLENYFGIIFAYMPSHIEIISPTKIELSNADFNELGNKLLARLHDYDALTKKFVHERNFLVNKLKEVAPQLFKKIKEDDAGISSSINKEEKKKSKKS